MNVQLIADTNKYIAGLILTLKLRCQ